MFVVAYMVAMFSSGVPPEVVVYILADEKFFSPYRDYMKRIRVLVSGYRYKFQSAANRISRFVTVTPFKEFLVRFGQAVAFGDNMESYLSREVDVALSEYNANMMRKLESMNNFLAIFGTLNSSLVFLMADVTIISLLYSAGETLIRLVFLAVVAVAGTMGIFMYSLYKPETYVVRSRLDNYLALFVVMVTVSVSFLVGNFEVVMASGVLLTTMGLWYRVKENRINSVERHYVLFVRYFSRNYSVIGNLRESMYSVMRGELGSLRPFVVRAIRRLEMGVDKDKVLSLLGDESGSVLIQMMNKVITTTVTLGGKVKEVGEMLSKVGDSILNVRSRREQNGRAFESTMYALQAASAGVSAALISITGILDKLFQLPSVSSVFAFTPIDIGGVERLLLTLLVALSYTNGLGISVAYGRSMHASLYFMGVLLLISGLTFHIALILTGRIFGALYSPGGIITPGP
ncbi:type II secretion system F family protein [Sulfodiicoccus acidiphilus]|uniref:type II secretion system F family protein n=1 Tax=Sulfodiicoccus acidiphilus TaxID=1670455 RepID=UPI0022B29BAF|nr:type II secretion system F family protein [Sulfodiicoccus acidiphilus]